MFLVISIIIVMELLGWFKQMSSSRHDNQILGRIRKANLSWSRTQAKFCQLFASLSVLISFLHWKSDIRISSLSYVCLSWSRITDKLVEINWQNFALVRFQLKFAFIIRLIITLKWDKWWSCCLKNNSVGVHCAVRYQYLSLA